LFPNIFNWTIPQGTGAEGILDPVARGLRAFGMYIVVVPPGTAKILSQEGYTKKKVKEYIYAHTAPSAPFLQPNTKDSPAPPLMPPKPNPDNMTVLVAGGPGGVYIASGVWIQWQEYVTKKLELPKAWDKVVAKYKNLVPVYAKY
jgi:hypothetical protein